MCEAQKNHKNQTKIFWALPHKRCRTTHAVFLSTSHLDNPLWSPLGLAITIDGPTSFKFSMIFKGDMCFKSKRIVIFVRFVRLCYLGTHFFSFFFYIFFIKRLPSLNLKSSVFCSDFSFVIGINRSHIQFNPSVSLAS